MTNSKYVDWYRFVFIQWSYGKLTPNTEAFCLQRARNGTALSHMDQQALPAPMSSSGTGAWSSCSHMAARCFRSCSRCTCLCQPADFYVSALLILNKPYNNSSLPFRLRLYYHFPSKNVDLHTRYSCLHLESCYKKETWDFTYLQYRT